MATPPTRVLYSTPAVGFLVTTSPKTTPTFNVVDGDLLTVVGTTQESPTTMPTPTTTGNVTWTLEQSISLASYCVMYLWTGVVNATATGVTVSIAAGTTGQWGFGVTVWRGHGGVGTSAEANVASGAPSLGITTGFADSAVDCGCSDYGANSGASRVWRTVNGSPMAESAYATSGSTYTTYAGYTLDAGAAGTQTVGLTAPSQKYSIVAVEILSPDSPPPPPSVKLRASGAVTSATAAVTAVNPAVPVGTVAGDLSVLAVCVKPYSATITTPSGWTKIGENTNGTVAMGVDLGSTKVALYVRESATVGAIGVIGQTGANSMGAVIHSYYKDPAATWDYTSFTVGGDTTNAADYSATGAAGLDVATGDRVIVAVCVNGDVGTPSAITLGGMAGATLGAFDVSENAVTTGNDISRIVGGANITAGTSNAAPTLTYTNTLSGSGAAIWLRIRAAGTSLTVNATFTAVGGLTAATTPKVAVTAPFTATGAFTASTVRAATVNAVFTATGALTATTTRTGTVTAGFTAAGAYTATTAPITAVTAPFTGSGAFTVIYGTVNITAVAAPFTGSGAFIAAVAPVTAVTAPFTGSGAFTSTVTPRAAVTAPFTGTGTLTATAAPKTAVTAPFTGAGALTAPAVPQVRVTTTFTAAGVFTAATAPTAAITAPFTGTGALTATLGSNANINAAFTGTGTYTATRNPIQSVTAPFTAAGVFTATAAPGVPYRALVTADGPSLYWRLGETTGTTAVDGSGNGLTGTYSATGVTLAQTSPVAGDTAARFTGASSGHVDRATTAALQLGWGAGRTWTIEFWLRMDSITVNAFPGVLGTGNGNVGAGNGWAIYFNASAGGDGSLWFRCNGIQDTPGPIIPTTNTWYHIAVTNTGTVLTWYVNGTQVGAPFTNPTGITPTSTAPFTVNPANYGDQSYDELAIYPTALPAARINAHYSNAATAEVTATAPFTGTGTLTAATAPVTAVTAEFTGDGALDVVYGTVDITSINAPFDGDGTLTATTAPITAVTAPFTGVGALTTTAVPQVTVTAPFTATGALTFTAITTRRTIPAPFTATGTLTTANTIKAAVTAPFTATGALTAAAVGGIGVPATFTGAGTLTAATSINTVITCLFTGTGALTATTMAVTSSTATFTSNGTLTAGTTPTTTVTATFTGDGTYTAPAIPITTGTTAAPFTSTGTLTATTKPTITVTSTFTGTGAYTATTSKHTTTTPLFTSAGTLTCTATRAGEHQNVRHPTATLNGRTIDTHFTHTGPGAQAAFTAPQHSEAAFTP